MERSKQSAIICMALLSLCTAVSGKIIYVDDDANGLDNGSSWQNAYKYLQDALADANSADKPVEICLARGTYKPDRSSDYPNGSRDRMASFRLINGVAIKGGYAGARVPDPDTRHFALYTTFLSGDLAGDDLNALPDNGRDNTYHVVYGGDTDRTAILDGVTITAGCADGWPSDVNIISGAQNAATRPSSGRRRDHTAEGGGMYVNRAGPTVMNCLFRNNHAYGGGGALYNFQGRPALTDCRFEENSSESSGGAVVNSSFSEPIFQRCNFRHNHAWAVGGAVYNHKSNVAFTNCTFTANCMLPAAGRLVKGGAILSDGGDLILRGCIMQGNSAYAGGALFCIDGNMTLENCTLAAGRAEEGEAIACDDMDDVQDTIRLTSCILHGTSEQIRNNGALGAIVIRYSNVSRAWPGEGNIDVAPSFAQPGHWADPNDPDHPGDPNDPNSVWVDGDYHLKSQAGRWDPNSQTWVKDSVTSPCIDAGDPNTPVGEEPFPNGGRINMGAYGGTAEASKSDSGEAMDIADETKPFSYIPH